MPIKIPNELPAAKVLTDEKIFIMTETRAITQDIRALKILLLNLMPTKIDTETQLSRLLGNTALQIELELIHTRSHESKNTPEDHLLAFHERIHGKVPAVPEDAKILMVVVFRGIVDGAVGGVHIQPIAVVCVRLVGLRPLSGIEAPVIVEADDFSSLQRAGGTVSREGKGGDQPHNHRRDQHQCQNSLFQVSHSITPFLLFQRSPPVFLSIFLCLSG